MYNVDNFKRSLEQLNIEITEKKIEQFLTYYDCLIEWNSFMNLTTITNFDEVIQKHFIDSLTLIHVYDLSKPVKILDLGTGAGFPGIPLKIVFPNLEIVLLDSLNKRIKFLNEVMKRVSLTGITTIHGRAEELGRNEMFREKFDLCVSRAVANLSTLTEYCIPFIKVSGKFIPYKSGNIKEEVENSIHGISILGGKIIEVHKFHLPDTEIERAFVVIEKVKQTPKKYPRSGGKPSKEPLIS